MTIRSGYLCIIISAKSVAIYINISWKMLKNVLEQLLKKLTYKYCIRNDEKLYIQLFECQRIIVLEIYCIFLSK